VASRGSIRWLGVAAAALLLLAGASGPANALSFTIPDGAQIIDIDTGSSATPSSYDGTTETLSIFSDIRVIRIDMDPWEISIAPGDVELSVQLTLQGTITDMVAVLLGYYSNGAADFTITDIAGGNEVIFAANFDSLVPLALNAPFAPFDPQVLDGVLGGDYTKIDLDNPFDDAIYAGGNLGIQLQALLVGGVQATTLNILDNPFGPPGGLQDFTFNPVSDLTPIPEPSTGWLVALGMVALATRSRRLR